MQCRIDDPQENISIPESQVVFQVQILPSKENKGKQGPEESPLRVRGKVTLGQKTSAAMVFKRRAEFILVPWTIVQKAMAKFLRYWTLYSSTPSQAH